MQLSISILSAKVLKKIATVALLVVVSEAADAQTVQSIEILDYGLYRTEGAVVHSTPGAQSGETITSQKFYLVTQTRTIPLRVGLIYGYRYRIAGRPNGALVNLKSVSFNPQPGIKNIQTGKLVLREEVSISKSIGAVHVDSYRDPPGAYTFELWQGERKLSSQVFNLQRRD